MQGELLGGLAFSHSLSHLCVLTCALCKRDMKTGPACRRSQWSVLWVTGEAAYACNTQRHMQSVNASLCEHQETKVGVFIYLSKRSWSLFHFWFLFFFILTRIKLTWSPVYSSKRVGGFLDIIGIAAVSKWLDQLMSNTHLGFWGLS